MDEKTQVLAATAKLLDSLIEITEEIAHSAAINARVGIALLAATAGNIVWSVVNYL